MNTRNGILRLRLIAVCGLVMVASTVEANLLTNGSFETASIPAPTGNVPVGSTAITGWIVTRNPIDYVGSEWVPPDGTRSIDLDGSPGAGGIAQSFATVAGTSYKITFDMAGHPVGPPTIKKLEIQAAGQSATFTFDVTGHSEPDNMGWAPRKWVFMATDSLTTLEFFSRDTSTFALYGPVLDNVTASAVPLPATVWLFGTGLLALASVFRKRRLSIN